MENALPSFWNRFPCSLPDSKCREGGARRLYKEDDLTFGAGKGYRYRVRHQASACGVPVEPSHRIDRSVTKAGRQNCLTIKDESL